MCGKFGRKKHQNYFERIKPINKNITLHFLAKMIDHSLLHPTITDRDILEGCALAKKI